MDVNEMTRRIADGDGFIAALDQSGGSTPKALRAYGVEDDAWSTDAEMYALIHAMRSRIITAPCFTGDRVLGAILFERTMDGTIDGRRVPDVLIDRGIVPFLKIDRGLEDEVDGVQRMKPIPALDDLLDRARELGIFGTKARSVVRLADEAAIWGIVEQQVELGRQVLGKGLVPILEPEVDIRSAERAEADRLLTDALAHALDAMPGDDRVMLKLSLPAEPGSYRRLIDHPRVLRVVALSGGYSRDEACVELARNPGIIASFSRALLSDLREGMDDVRFDRTLDTAIGQIHAASTAGV